MDRQQMTSAQLKSIPSASFVSTPFASDPIAVEPLIPMQSGTLVITDPPQTHQSTAPILLEQSAELIDKMPQNVATDSHFEEQFLQNLHEYKMMKRKESSSQENYTNSGQDLEKQESQPVSWFAAKAAPVTIQENTANLQPLQPVGQNNAPDTVDAMREAAQEPAKRYSLWSQLSEAGLSAQTLNEGSIAANELADDNKIQIAHSQKTEEITTKNQSISNKKGVIGAVSSFFGDLASGLTLGLYRPKGEDAPVGLARVVYPFKKLVYDAPIKDLAIGVPVGIAHSAGSVFKKREKQEATPLETAQTTATQETNRYKYRRRFSLDYASLQNSTSNRRTA
jgi:hypothetical protein